MTQHQNLGRTEVQVFNAISTPAVTAAAYVIILMTFIVTSIAIAPNVSRYKTDSNKRAMMRPCPPSSVSAAENSPATDHAAKSAPRNGQRDATPDPRRTPPSGDWATHTACGHKQ